MKLKRINNKYMLHNITSQLLQKLTSAYSEAGLNNSLAHLQVINHSTMNSKDESSFETLIIGFNPYESSPEDASIQAAEFISEQAKPLAKEILCKFYEVQENEISTHNMGNMTLLSFSTQEYITILCSDETVYITSQFAADF